MDQMISLGPFMVQKYMAVIVLGIIAGYLVVNKCSQSEKQTQLLFSNVLIVLLIWRFGHVLFQFQMLMENFYITLTAPGTTRDLVIGLAASLLYTAYNIRRQRLNVGQLTDLLSIGLLIFFMINHLFLWKYGVQTDVPWGVSITIYCE